MLLLPQQLTRIPVIQIAMGGICSLLQGAALSQRAGVCLLRYSMWEDKEKTA